MLVHGRVRDGIIVLDEGVDLPDGQHVTVFAPGRPAGAGGGHPTSVLTIPAISLGTMLQPPDDRADILEEMLEGRT